MDYSKNQPYQDVNPETLSAMAERMPNPSNRGQRLRDRAIKRHPKTPASNYTPPKKKRKKVDRH